MEVTLSEQLRRMAATAKKRRLVVSSDMIALLESAADIVESEAVVDLVRDFVAHVELRDRKLPDEHRKTVLISEGWLHDFGLAVKAYDAAKANGGEI